MTAWVDRLGIDSQTTICRRNSISKIEMLRDSGMKADAIPVEFARCFLRLANLPNFALDRLSRYRATLWRQASRSSAHSERLIAASHRSDRAAFWLASEDQIERE
jgi:hypothetical protein